MLQLYQVGQTPLTHPAFAVSIGCTLGYRTSGRAPMLLLCTPQPDQRRQTVLERFHASPGVPVTRATDSHGNLVLRAVLAPGYNEFRHEGVYLVPDVTDDEALPAYRNGGALPMHCLPLDVLRYTLPSRYCESDRLYEFAVERFAAYPPGLPRVQAVCRWVRRHIEYRYGSGSPLLSACDILRRGYGVCRDFAHVAIALCRALDLPARYVAGHIARRLDTPYANDSDIGSDFHAYMEVYLGGEWRTFDARFGESLAGRIKLAHGLDAVDAAFATFQGEVEAVRFEVRAHEIRLEKDEDEDESGLAAGELAAVAPPGRLPAREVLHMIERTG